MKELECSQDFSHYKFMGIFMDVLVTYMYEEDPIKNEGVRVFTTFSPLKPYGSYLLPWKPEFQSDLAQNLMPLSPTPMMLQIKFGCDRPAGCGNIHV